LWKANIASYTFWSKKRKRSMVPNNANWKRNTKIHHIYSQETIPTQYNLKPANKIHTYALRSSSAGQLIGNCIPPPPPPETPERRSSRRPHMQYHNKEPSYKRDNFKEIPEDLKYKLQINHCS
jgi:hypothetical protein